jgi:Dolichyl-phosphate-mannose-protein mannosyltransferase
VQPIAHEAPGRRDRRWEALIVVAILLLAAGFRLVKIASLPPGLYQDEAVYGINARIILDGHPSIYFGEREPLYEYLVAGMMLALGPTALALRVTSALVGVVGVAAGGALARQLFGRAVGLLTAAGLAASLWLTVLSRVGFRAITFPMVECLGLALLWRATRTGRMRDYLLSGAVLGLTLYTYLAARFLPIALLVFVVLCLLFNPTWLRARWRGLLLAGAVAVGVCLPLAVYALHRPDMLLGRADQVALPAGTALLPALRDSTLQTLGMFLLAGDPNWRQNLSGAPVFDPLNGLIFLLGVLVCLGAAFRAAREPAALLILAIGSVLLLPGMLSIDSPHYLRTEGAAVAAYTLWALGLTRVASWLWEKGRPPSRVPLALLVIALAVGVAIARTGFDYFGVYARSPAMPGAFNADLAATGKFLAASPLWQTSRSNVFVTDRYQVDHASIAFFLYSFLRPTERPNWLDDRVVGSFFPQDELIPMPVAPSLYVVAGDGQPVLDALGPAVQRMAWVNDDPLWPTRAIWAQPASPAGSDATASATSAHFGQILQLESATIVSGDAHATFGPSPPPTATAILRWRILGRPSYRPSIYVHVEDEQHHSLGQSDQELGFAVADWQIGQELVTRHPVRLSAGTAPGRYPLSVGVYDKATGARESATVGGRPVPTVVAGALDLAEPIPGAVAIASRLDRGVAGGLVLVGADATEPSVSAGTALSIGVVWQATRTIRPDYTASFLVRDASGNVVGTKDEPVGGASYRTSRWAPDQVVRQIVDVPIIPTASGKATLTVVIRSGDSATAARAGDEVPLATVQIAASSHDFRPPHPAQPLAVAFGSVGRLIGLTVPNQAYHPGDTVSLTLYWQATSPSDVPDTVFVHLLDAQNKIVGQRDEPPGHGNRPTTGWVAGEYLADPHDVTIDPATPPGAYQLEVGLYDPQTGQRVQTDAQTDRAVVGPVRVTVK